MEVARPSNGRSNVVELDGLPEVFQGTFLAVSNRLLGASGQREVGGMGEERRTVGCGFDEGLLERASLLASMQVGEGGVAR